MDWSLLGAEFSPTYSPTYSPTIHKPFEMFAPQYQMDYSYAPTVQIESPNAKGATISTKKEAASTPKQSSTVSPISGSDFKQNDPMGTLLLLGVVVVGGAIAVSFISKKK